MKWVKTEYSTWAAAMTGGVLIQVYSGDGVATALAFCPMAQSDVNPWIENNRIDKDG